MVFKLQQYSVLDTSWCNAVSAIFCEWLFRISALCSRPHGAKLYVLSSMNGYSKLDLQALQPKSLSDSPLSSKSQDLEGSSANSFRNLPNDVLVIVPNDKDIHLEKTTGKSISKTIKISKKGKPNRFNAKAVISSLNRIAFFDIKTTDKLKNRMFSLSFGDHFTSLPNINMCILICSLASPFPPTLNAILIKFRIASTPPLPPYSSRFSIGWKRRDGIQAISFPYPLIDPNSFLLNAPFPGFFVLPPLS
ncbi:hypothetical protein CEXT_230481 [Caerostris extrusa]|uniref:Uncharacterized protein n=1 Tax=Caerostris extrusa TaxID=172846 RepID=A0AAV4U9L4_CAEEX|nr:hypothetical protein CEXT_230481 [Caerostris extrusa]